MKSNAKVFLVFVLAGFMCTQAYCAQKNLEKLKKEYKETVELGDYKLAIDQAHSALQIAQEKYGQDSLESAYILNDIADFNFNVSNYSQANLFYKETFKIYQKRLPENDEKITEVLNNIGMIYSVNEQFETAELYLQRSLELSKSRLGENNRVIAKLLDNLGMASLGLQKSKKAEELFLKSLDIYQNNSIKKDLEKTNVLSNLGFYYFINKKYNSAEEYLLQGLEILEKADYPINNNTTFNILNNSVLLYIEFEDFEKAERLLKKLLELSSAKYGEYHSDASYYHKVLGYIYLYEEKFTDAEIEFRKGNEKLLADYAFDDKVAKDYLDEIYTEYNNKYKNPDEFISIENYCDLLNLRAAIYEISNQYGFIRDAYQLAFDVSREKYSLNHPKTLETVAKMGQAGYGSDSLWIQVVKLLDEQPNSNDVIIAKALFNHAKFVKHNGKDDQKLQSFADSLLAISFQVRKKKLGLKHLETIESLEEFARSIWAGDNTKIDSTKILLESALSLRKKTSQYDDPETINTLITLAHLNRMQDDYDKYFQYYVQILNLSQKLYGKMHKKNGLIAQDMAEQYLKLGNFAESEKYYLLALDNHSYGKPLNVLMLISLSNLAEIYKKLEQWERYEEFHSRFLQAQEILWPNR